MKSRQKIAYFFLCNSGCIFKNTQTHTHAQMAMTMHMYYVHAHKLTHIHTLTLNCQYKKPMEKKNCLNKIIVVVVVSVSP